MKYKLVFTLLFIITVNVLASDKKEFVVEGKIGKLSAPARVFLLYNDPVTNLPVRDSTLLDEGRFMFKGKVDYPVYAHIIHSFNGDIRYATGSDERKFYLEAGQININGRQLFNAEVKGSATQLLLDEYFDIVRPVQNKMIETRNDMDDIYKPYSPEYRLSLDSVFNTLNEEYNRLSMDFIKAHPGSMLSVNMLSSEVASHPDNDVVEALYEGLSAEMKNSAPGKRLKQDIRNRSRLRTGNIAPDFTAATLQGDSLSLSEYRDKWVLLLFWSPTCDICHREAQELKKIYSKYKDKGFEIIAFTIEDAENKDEWKKAAGELRLPYITVSDLKGWSSPIVQNHKINAVPENYFINPHGLVDTVDLYSFDLERKLQSIFKP